MPKMRTDDGVELNYHIDDFRDPWITEPGDTILMCHGFAKSMKFWVQWVPALSRKYTVVRYDIRGCGESSVPPEGATWSAERLARDVVNLIDNLAIEKVHWIGFESGGVWGMVFASTYPDRIKSLTLCNSPLLLGEGTILSRGEPIRGSEALEKVGFRQWLVDTRSVRFDLSSVDPKLMEWHISEQSKTTIQVAQSIRRIARSVDISGALPSINVPTLIMVGDRSPPSPLAGQISMQKQIPNARLMVFPSIGSNIQLLIPDRCLDEVLGFLEEAGE